MAPWSTTPPQPRTRMDNWPTVLFSWWATCFAAVIIITRLCSRKVRSNKLFREDWVMMLALVPLFVRMGCVHVVMLYGTNNVQTVGRHLTATELEQRSIGSRLVLASRVFYAAFIWTSKLTVSEFLKRITTGIWRKSYEMTLQGIRIFLGATFIAVVIATLAECQPFDHYWQVVPDPGPQCRLGYAQLLTMGICDIITDILLVAFPIPIVLRSGQTWKRKLQLVSLFSLSLAMIAVTATRMPEVIFRHSRQQYRTVWASCEILASAAVSNAVILGSFLRDKGTKKNKYRSHSVSDSIDRASVRRPTMAALQRYGSDEDLFRSLGCRVPAHLLGEDEDVPRLAPAALSAKEMARIDSRKPSEVRKLDTRLANENAGGSTDDSLRQTTSVEAPPSSPAPSTKRSVSFFDVGGLLEDSAPSWGTRSRSTTLVDTGASGTIAHDFAPSTPEQSRRGSRAFLADLGGVVPGMSRNGNGNGYGRRQSDAQQSPHRHRGAPIGLLGPMLERHETQQSLQDAGGLLSDDPRSSERPEVASHDPRLAQTVPVERESTQNLQDLGGLLSEQHTPDLSAAAMQRVAGRRRTNTASRAQPTAQSSRAYEEMSLHDPGGLLS